MEAELVDERTTEVHRFLPASSFLSEDEAGVGVEARICENARAVMLILHESSKPPTTVVHDWTTKKLCKVSNCNPTSELERKRHHAPNDLTKIHFSGKRVNQALRALSRRGRTA
jgi:hypothetical protein